MTEHTDYPPQHPEERPEERSSDQWWFWDEWWQAGEREADAALAAGNTTFYASAEEFLAAMDVLDDVEDQS